MQRRVVRLMVMVLATTVAASANASDWGNIAVISDTLGNHAGRLCMGEGLRVSDIGCPSYAPSLTTAGDISVTGNLSANKFIGDGSGLTGVGQSDRIVSGTTSVVANNGAGISFTTAGTATARLSATGDFIARTLAAADSSNNNRIVVRPDLNYIGIMAADQLVWRSLATGNFFTGGTNDIGIGRVTAGLLKITDGSTGLGALAANQLGVATTSPTSTLQVSGSFIVSTSAQTTTPSLYVGTNGNVGIGTSAPATQLDVRGTGVIGLGSSAAQAATITGGGAFALNSLVSGRPIIFQIQSTERMRVDATTGYVGIGTSTPSATLTVSGSAIVSGTVQVAGTGNEACTAGTLGTIRFNPVTGAPQICVQR